MLALIVEATFLALAICLTFEGARRIRAHGMGRPHLWPFVAGALLWVAVGGMYFVS